MKYNVCSIVVTFNRKDLLKVNIRSLLDQTYHNDILIVDNNSTDGTYEMLQSEFALESDPIIYINTGKNIGGAGGFAYGLKHAFDLAKYDYFWLMDDDGHPVNDNTLELLVDSAEMFNNNYIINSLVVDQDNEKLTFGLYKYDKRSQIKEKYIEGYNNPFNGTLIPKTCVEQIGYPRKEYVLGCDEVEYMNRFTANGGKLVTICESLYYHPTPKVKTELWHGKQIIRPDGGWRYYYRVRNTVDCKKKYESKSNAIQYGIKKIFSSFLLARPQKIKKTYIAYRAVIDGYRGDFSANDFHLTGKYRRR